MTRYNFSSIFAWNIFLYTGFLALVAVYLWTLMDRPGKRYARAVGTVAFLWRIVLTTGTGSIFGFLVAREAYDAAVLAPLFVVLSLALGTAAFLLVLMIGFRAEGRPLGFHLLGRLRTLLGIFVAALLYFVATHFLTLLYATEHHGVLRFLLLEGDGLTRLFWVGQIALGGVLPLLLLFLPRFADSRMWLGVAAALVLLGGWVQVYVLLIGGQAYPLDIFPGMEVSSRFMDGAIQSYVPAWPEFALGLGGVALSGLLLILAMRVLRFLPEDLGDERVDPHARSRVATTAVAAE